MTTLKKLCMAFVQRSQSLGLRGKKRDDALIEFMVGAANALTIAGAEDDAKHVTAVLAVVFSVRGFSECMRIACEPEADPVPTAA